MILVSALGSNTSFFFLGGTLIQYGGLLGGWDRGLTKINSNRCVNRVRVGCTVCTVYLPTSREIADTAGKRPGNYAVDPKFEEIK